MLGQFKAQNIETKRTIIAGRCFLPDVMMDMIVANFKIGKAKGFNTLQFACLIGIRPNDDVATGYEYYAQSLMPPDEATDPFRAIQSKVEAFKSSLPAPEGGTPTPSGQL